MLATAALLLAVGPVFWLVETWRDPAFDSSGFLYFLIFAALFGWSVSNPRRSEAVRFADKLALGLLGVTALVRLAGQVLAIDTIGALALAIDVFAIALLLRLDRRRRALSPLWLAVVFAFSLPLERIAQRCIGYGLQEISARGACALLSAGFQHVSCEGARIGVSGADVLVDLPCSGSRALLTFGFVFAVMAALTRPRPAMAALGAGLALAAACFGNMLRIALIATGVAIGPNSLGFDIMSEPWHDLAGLLALGAVFPVLLIWVAKVRPGSSGERRSPSSRFAVDMRLSATLLAAASLVVIAPRHPLDVTRASLTISAPARIGAFSATPVALSDREQAYFTQYGGGAVKAGYGPYALLLTRTSAPLRHLHAPDECLRGLGFKVEYLGARFAPLPTASYRATAPDGHVYRIEVTFVSNKGRAAASVAEAVWVWLADRSTLWGAVERISPENISPDSRAAFDAGVIAALDLPHASPSLAAAREGALHAS